MAGSLAHIIAKDGCFNMDLIENMGDAYGALEECFHIILLLSAGDMGLVSTACNALNYPDPYEDRYGEGVPAAMTDGSGCKHQWTESLAHLDDNGDFNVRVCCSKCDEQVGLSDFLREKHHGL